MRGTPREFFSTLLEDYRGAVDAPSAVPGTTG